MRVDQLKLTPAGLKTETQNAATAAEGTKPFSEFLSAALEEVNQLDQNAKQASLNLAAGKIQDISEVMIATEKATIALQLTMQVRNKVIDAYQEIMRMQV